MPLDPDREKKVDPNDIGDDARDAGVVAPNGNFKKFIIALVIIGVIAFAWAALTWYGKKGSAKPEPSAPSATATQQAKGGDQDKPWLNQSGQSSPQAPPAPQGTEPTIPPVKEGLTPGIKDISQNTNMTMGAGMSPDSFTKDLNGIPVALNYQINEIYIATDFVSYTKRRATTAEGIELLWLDAEYKGKPCKIQVPLRIFKELDSTGVTVVSVEVAKVKGSDGKEHEIVTDFVVRDDYKKILDQKK
jgi:hypothetical protein